MKKLLLILFLLFGQLIVTQAHAAPVVESTGATNEVFTGTITLAAPAGITNGDILVARIYQVFGGSTAPTLSGWTLIGSCYDIGGDFNLCLLWKRASGESGSYAFTSDAAYQTGFIERISGAIASGDPIDVVGTGATGTSTTATATSVTTTVADTLLLWTTGTFGAGTTVTSPPSGMTGTQAIAIYGGSRAQVASGATGTQAGTLSASDTWGTIMTAIKPAAGGGSSPLLKIYQQH